MDILDKLDNYLLENSALLSHLLKNGNKIYYHYDDLYKTISGAMHEPSFKLTANKQGIDIQSYNDKDGQKKFTVKVMEKEPHGGWT